MGRHKKEVLEGDELEDSIILKLFEPYVDENGELKFKRTQDTLTLEEMAMANWMTEGRVKPKPMTKMGELKSELRTLHKIKMKMLKSGLSEEDLRNWLESLSESRRSSAKTYGNFQQPEE